MTDTSVKKVQSGSAPRGEMGQTHLVSGKRVAMRLWRDEASTDKAGTRPSRRDYETVGFVLGGRAKLILEGQTITLEPGDSWLVPAGAEHHYEIEESFSAVEATAPPAQVRGRDAAA